MPAKTVVFVQGGFLKDKEEVRYPWMFYHFHPTKDVDLGPVNLVFFDYPAGTLKVWKNYVLKRGQYPKVAPDEEIELFPKVKLRLSDGKIDEKSPERASIVALYDWVKKQDKESIISLQIFSHGVQQGPIIWNSYEFASGKEMIKLSDEIRDPHDTDGRMRDFMGKNPLAGAAGKRFAQSFAPDPFIKLWGCTFGEARDVLRNYWDVPPGAKNDGARAAHVKDYMGFMRPSYPARMARLLNLPVWAAATGYGSDPTAKVPKSPKDTFLIVKYNGAFPPNLKKHQWWRVSWFFRHQDRGALFYEKVLKAPIDSVDFVQFRKDWFEAVERSLRADQASLPFDSPMDLQRRLTDRIRPLGVG